jgi:hypothetical protein
MKKQETKEPNRPTHGVYVVQGEGENARWVKIGAGWLHKDNKGANLMLDALPMTGKVVVREFSEQEETPAEGAQK